jgi:hypothetical protein
MGFESLNSIVFFLVAIAVLVTFHEFGHFIVARWAGVRVLRFSVGFGRSIWKRQSHPEATEYVIGLIPLGGYVKMLDEREGPVSTTELNRSFNRKPLSSRALIVAAGPAANLLLAVLLYWIVGVVGSQDLDPVIGKVAPTSHGEAAGFQVGMGARIFEKHFTLNKEDEGPDHFYALEPEELESYVKAIHEAYLTLGSREKEMLPKEREVGRREGLYASRDLSQGEEISTGDFYVGRPALGLSPRYSSSVMGSTLVSGLGKDEPITWRSLKFRARK